MKKEGLLKAPEFDNVEKYLKPGKRTQITPEIQKMADKVEGKTDGEVLRKLLVLMHKETTRLEDEKNQGKLRIDVEEYKQMKFKRSADEILKSKIRTGCCDSSTLFTALARSKGIPSIQIITLNKKKDSIKWGHYYTACYMKDLMGNSDWYLFDPDMKVSNKEEVKIMKCDRNKRNIENAFYAYAYVNDYSELGIDSQEKMYEVQEYALNRCDRKDFDNELER